MVSPSILLKIKLTRFVLLAIFSILGHSQGIITGNESWIKIDRTVIGFIDTKPTIISCAMNEKISLPVLKSPKAKSKILKFIKTYYEINSIAYSEDDYRVAVYGRKAGWFKIRINKTYGWLPASSVAIFDPIEVFIKKISWIDVSSGSLFESPNYDSTPTKLDYATAKPYPEIYAKCLEVRLVEGELWMKVFLFEQSQDPHDETTILKRPATGWIPAFNSDGFFIGGYPVGD